MQHSHIISNENIKEYETLLELYKNKDFSTVRNEKENTHYFINYFDSLYRWFWFLCK